MDLGLKGKNALVCAASKGLGRACAFSLAREGVDLVIAARTPGPLEETAQEIRKETGVTVETVACDVTSDEGRASLFAASSAPDILVNNAGGPPPGDFRSWNRDDWIRALDANMISAILMIKGVVDGMIDRKFGRIVNITSGAVKQPIEALGLSNGARAGLTGFVAGLSRQTAVHNVTVNNLLPGPFETERLFSNMASAAEKAGRTAEELANERRASNPSKRFGTPAEFGDLCAYVCSAQAGYMTGQNFLIDGGAYRGTL